jgi:two-component system response regulator PilR (NtrC family)
VGGTEEVPIDVRVIAATNKDLSKMVSEGVFREDLFYRVSVIPIEVPPLRDRREDVPLLANHFLKKYAPAAGKSIVRIAASSLQQLCNYDWPGNVRQLENTIEHAVAMETTAELHVDLRGDRPRARAAAAGANGNGSSTRESNGLPSPPESLPSEGIDLERYIAAMERSLIQSALRQTDGVQTKAAGMLKLSYRSFRHLLKKYDI